jgi:hypothetical protein
MKRFLAVALSLIWLASFSGTSIAAEPTNPECTITGDQTSETLFGTPEADVICGMGGNDIIYALEGNDIVIGGAGDDYIEGGAGSDDIWGGIGADSLSGQSGVDELFGGEGNDGLSGGSGTDTLRGEGGVDMCVDFTKDNYLKSDCFYDRSLPTIKSVAFSSVNPKVDVTKGSKSLELRVSVSDAGAGLLSFDIYFAPTAKLKEGAYYAGGAIRDATVSCSKITQENIGLDVSDQKPVTNCLLSGTPNRGVYKVSVNLPATMPKGEFSVAGMRFEDQAHNARSLEWDDVAKRKLQVKFTQNGAPDRAAPKITGATIVGSKVVRNANEKVTARIAFKDAGGHAFKSLWLNYDVPESGYELDPGFSQWVSLTRELKSCDAVEFPGDACLYSGTASNGVLQFYLDVDPKWHDLKFLWKAQKLVPKDFSIEDSLGNQYQGTVSSTLASALTYYKGFSGKAPVDDKDFKAPTLVDFTVDKTRVDTGVSSQTITAKVTLKDTGAGLNRYNGNVNLELYMDGGSAAWCSAVGNATGTTAQATYTFKCVLDAHVAAGTYGFSLSASDMSLRANTLFRTPSQMVSGGKVVNVKNG